MDQKTMRELENRCIQEHAAFCTATCPIHVDVRAMLAAVAQGDFAAGLKALRKTLPFPGVIGAICGANGSEPCRMECKREPAGGAIHIAQIEQACVAYGGPYEPVTALPSKPRHVAIIGGGLSGLTAAYDLRRKGYAVVIYEATDRLGGQAWQHVPNRLSAEALARDLEVIHQLDIEVLFNTPVGKTAKNGHQPPLSLLCEEYEAIYIGVGAANGVGSETYGLNLDADGRIAIDPQTRQTSQSGVFAGGGMLLAAGAAPFAYNPLAETTLNDKAAIHLPARSPVYSIMDGRRAAVSIDRYLQRVSLTAARASEGPYTTRLFTHVADLEPQAETIPLDPGGRYTPGEAMAEARRCIQCECMECVKNCAFLKQYGGYPKKYIREIYNNLSIVMGTRHSNKLINSCSLCGLCGEICPEDVDMGAVCKEARALMVTQKRMPPSAHDFALLDMAFSNGPHFALARHEPGKSASALVFFPGCQLSASRPEQTAKMYAHLRHVYAGRLPDGSGVGLALRCCGAPADWAGQVELFAQSQAEFRAEYEALGRPKLVLACSSCYQVFKTHYPDVEIVSLWEVLAQEGLPERSILAAGSPATGAPLAIHDPCSTRYEAGIQDSVRRILAQLGVQVEELPLNRERTECCSYGGVMWLANPALAEETVRRRVVAHDADYITYCAMCRDFFVRQGKPTLHILDLIVSRSGDEGPESEELAAIARRRGPDYSERHANRAGLKRRLLQELWSEEMDDTGAESGVPLIISEDLRQTLEKRLILVDEIRQVIETAEQTGGLLVNKHTGHRLASQKLGSVTYWVEYTPQAGGFEIHNAYSHRMELGDEAAR